MTTNYSCQRCGDAFSLNDDELPHTITNNINNTNYGYLCNDCFSGFRVCDACGELVSSSYLHRAVRMDNDNETFYVCRMCRHNHNQCSSCGVVLLDNGIEVNSGYGFSSEYVCRDCNDQHYIDCAMCGNRVRRQTRTINGIQVEDICRRCANHHYRQCSMCANHFSSHNGGIVDGSFYCTPCIENHAIDCDDCGEPTFNIQTTHDGSGVCPECANANYVYCDECDEYCEPDHNHGRIHDYTYKPSPILHGREANELRYGLENEFEACGNYNSREITQSIIEKYSDNEDRFYIKHDGSLDHGAELVTHPFTLTLHMKNSWLADALAEISRMGGKSHDTSTCGLHVHITKAAFIDGLHQTRFAWMIYESGFTIPIARRSWNSYAQHAHKTLSTTHPDNTSNSRYEAVNFENTHTVEVRIFKGTLKVQTILITLQYLDAVFHFTEAVRLPVLASSARDTEFLKFIKHKPKYTKLYDYLANLSH